MSTDIHGPFIEMQFADDTWFCQAELEWGQNYEVFTLMSGVRSESTELSALFEPRGIPSRCSYHYLENHHSGNCAAESWLTTDEMAQVLAACEAIPDMAPAWQLGAAVAFMRTLESGIAEAQSWTEQRRGTSHHFDHRVRALFCFDK